MTSPNLAGLIEALEAIAAFPNPPTVSQERARAALRAISEPGAGEQAKVVEMVEDALIVAERLLTGRPKKRMAETRMALRVAFGPIPAAPDPATGTQSREGEKP